MWNPKNELELEESINNGSFYNKLMESVEIIPKKSDQDGKIELSFIFPYWFNWLEESSREYIKKSIKQNAQKAFDNSKN